MEDEAALAIFYASIVAMRFHPGNKAAGLDLDEDMDLAADMLNLWRQECQRLRQRT
ncbi:MAG: hypothetical protein [Microvirus sp.]|nr:MAG: hypothetical protein [Microvirus sp.]